MSLLDWIVLCMGQIAFIIMLINDRDRDCVQIHQTCLLRWTHQGSQWSGKSQWKIFFFKVSEVSEKLDQWKVSEFEEGQCLWQKNYENQYLFMLAMAFFFVFAWSSMPQIVPDIILCI